MFGAGAVAASGKTQQLAKIVTTMVFYPRVVSADSSAHPFRRGLDEWRVHHPTGTHQGSVMRRLDEIPMTVAAFETNSRPRGPPVNRKRGSRGSDEPEWA